jgi:UDP-N-acetylmuramoylalanine--D-glutamate ligase
VKEINKVSILGLGKSGIAAANLAIRLKYKVFISDIGKKKPNNLNKKIEIEFEGHSDRVLNSDIIIKSPGIHNDIDIIKKAQKRNIPIISELDFALKYSKFKKIVAVTGTNGKTTVTDLISKIIKNKYKDSITAGNIGFPLSDYALKTSPNTIITMELSSYQLEDTPNFKSDISVILNITPDHIEHHKTMRNYIEAKKKILINQKPKDIAIVNYDDKICRKISAFSKAKIVFFSKSVLKEGVYYDNGKIIFSLKNKKSSISPKINIRGAHNIENILAAATAAFYADVDLKIIEKTISSYKGMKHRIEFIRSIRGVDYYNDSKATNVDSTKTALQSFQNNVILIMGGLDKGFPYLPIKKLVKEKVKALLLIGQAASKINRELSKTTTIYDCLNINNAIKKARDIAVKGDTVLLSPACASFDQFKDFEERGEVFRRIVKCVK